MNKVFYLRAMYVLSGHNYMVTRSNNNTANYGTRRVIKTPIRGSIVKGFSGGGARVGIWKLDSWKATAAKGRWGLSIDPVSLEMPCILRAI